LPLGSKGLNDDDNNDDNNDDDDDDDVLRLLQAGLAITEV